MTNGSPDWCRISNVEEIPSPSLIFYIERIDENVRRMIQIAGGPERLRPHLKTHKTAELLRLQMAYGIAKFKCATIAEAEMAGRAGVKDLLLAYQPVGPNVRRLLELIRRFPGTRFSALLDDAGAAASLSKAAQQGHLTVDVYLDLDCGQRRSGVAPSPEALGLYKQIASLDGLHIKGLHAYDGHIHDSDPIIREQNCESSFRDVANFSLEIQKTGLPAPHIIAGGTPTFPIHAKRKNVECSPGTCVLWDHGYASKLPDMDFLPAALVLTRVVSKPHGNRICLDLGHKAVASENPHPRVFFPALPNAVPVMHSEEHLVLETPHPVEFSIGRVLYGIPWHICPTVALHAHAIVVTDSNAGEKWAIARDRTFSI
ncbi:MAG TPA: D-TA family PLP-dependent enzyme [Candidatus Saccharimonadales bacterium]|nr:D-TA family PLP-dependent enzyme [Candidatus Saccharimonadales bacterium]